MTNPNAHAETLQNFRAMGLPLHMVQRFFPEAVREEIRKVEKPGSAVLASERPIESGVMRRRRKLHEFPKNQHKKALRKPEGDAMGPAEYANNVKVANAMIENCVIIAAKGKTRYVKTPWEVTAGGYNKAGKFTGKDGQ